MKFFKLLLVLLIIQSGVATHTVYGDEHTRNAYIEMYQIGDYLILLLYTKLATRDYEDYKQTNKSSDDYYHTGSEGSLKIFLNDGTKQKCKEYRGDTADWDPFVKDYITADFDPVYLSNEDANYISFDFPHNNEGRAKMYISEGYKHDTHVAFIGISETTSLEDLNLDTKSDGSYSDRSWSVYVDGSSKVANSDEIELKFHFSADDIESCSEVCDIVSTLQDYFDPDTTDETTYSTSDWENLYALLFTMYNDYYNDDCIITDCDD
ncbi:hypothetical protein [Rubellicoccus peritrichatus]|uniref:Uncharacterized protein n=1 Tax=Rubellicoccus peritrichatus TaxID=3080537 RepID=A0AAQ3LD12_9BACT|nr:hypothetical protein [Puniceicoccus sp. CR14]WOO39739.1 hypothetical protein RZN69_14035 [Puniceicoccus sp. CR14]